MWRGIVVLVVGLVVGACGDDEDDCDQYAEEAERIREEILAQWTLDEGDNAAGEDPCFALINDWYVEQCEAHDAASERAQNCRAAASGCVAGTEGCLCRLGGVCDDGLRCVSDQCVAAVAYRGASYFQATTDGCDLGASGAFTIPEGTQPTTQTLQGPRVEDGTSGAEVQCEVSSQGDGYFLTGTVVQGDRSFTVTANVSPTDDGGHAGLGTVIQVDSAISTNLRSDADSCEITVMPNQDVAPGRVWGNFSCARVASGPVGECEALGSFVFENCDR